MQAFSTSSACLKLSLSFSLCNIFHCAIALCAHMGTLTNISPLLQPRFNTHHLSCSLFCHAYVSMTVHLSWYLAIFFPHPSLLSLSFSLSVEEASECCNIFCIQAQSGVYQHTATRLSGVHVLSSAVLALFSRLGHISFLHGQHFPNFPQNTWGEEYDQVRVGGAGAEQRGMSKHKGI